MTDKTDITATEFNFDVFMYGIRRDAPFDGSTLADSISDDEVRRAESAFNSLLKRAEKAESTFEAERQRADNYEQVAHGLAAELAALKDGQMPVPPTVSFFRDGIVAAANWVDQSREAFERENGQIDPDTGTFEFSNNAGAEYSSILFDVAEGIRQLHPNAEPATTQKPFKDIAPNDVVPVGQDWFRVRYITRHGDSTSVHLQREVEKLHPLKQNDVIHLSVENAVPLFIAVKGD